MSQRFRSVLALPFVWACATAGGDEGDPTWQTVTTKAGDTTVVRTTGVEESAAIRQLVAEWSIGSTEGDTPYSFGQISEVAVGPANDVFVFDRQPISLRQYDSAGTFVRWIGREGQGPGEYRGANGLAVHRDGRVALWDQGNRVNFYGPTGDLLGSTPVPGGGQFYTSGALVVDTLGNSYIRTRVGDPPPGDDVQRSGRMFGIAGLVRYDAGGTVRDSLTAPDVFVDAPRLIAQQGGGTSMSNVPFSPRFLWSFSPHGYFVSVRTDAYAIALDAPGGPTRIEMDAERVPVTAEEKSDHEEATTSNMRFTDPNWRWNGAPIPDVKQHLKGLSVAGDGRIWVSISRPGELIPPEERAEPRVSHVGSGAGGTGGQTVRGHVRVWREPTVYDVFEPDGRYLGRVPMPERVTWRAARGDVIWAVTRDSLDVEQVTRLRVTPGFGSGGD